MKKEYILYIIVRNDLPSLNAGKAMAQASHASNAFIHKYGKTSDAKLWAAETPQGFGTVIVLSANQAQILEVCKNKTDCLFDVIIDPTYPYIVNTEIAGLIDKSLHTVDPIVKQDGTVVLHRKEITCAYIFGEKIVVKEHVKHLPLHP
jgi:hypothetical protein